METEYFKVENFRYEKDKMEILWGPISGGGGPYEFPLSVHCTQTNTCCTPYKQTHIHTQTIKYTHTHKQTDSHTDMVFILL